MKMNSVRWNIGFGMFVLMSVISFGVYQLLTYGPHTDVEEVFRNRFNGQASVIASALNSGIETEDIEAVSNRLKRLVDGEDLVYAIVASEYGIVSSFNQRPGDINELSQITALPGISTDGNLYRVSLPINADSYLQLYAGFSTTPALEAIQHTRQRAVLIGLIIFIVGIGGSTLISAWITRPLNQLVAAATSAESGELDSTVQTVPDDEIGTVAQSFNTMSTRVKELNDQLDAATEDMALYANELEALKKDRARFESALKASEKRFRTIVDNTNDVFIVVDNELKIKWVSASYSRISGIKASNAVGLPLADLFHAEDAQNVCSFINLIDESDDDRRGIEARCKHVEGTWHDTLIHVKDLRNATGIGGILLTITDINETKRTQRELVQAKETAEEMIRLKDSFLANMSHEIRTPLTGILGFAQVLLEELQDEQKQLAKYIKDGGDRLLKTLNSFLDLAELESNSINHNVERLDLVAETRNVAAHFVPEAQSRGLNLDVIAEHDVLFARIDRSIFVRIVQNLIHNAFKFTEDGSVLIRLYAEEEWVRIEVEDTGVGISEEFIPSLFKEFHQESSGLTRSHEGAGLGLAITRRLLTLMGGSIEVTSTKGEGTTFTFRVAAASNIHKAESDRPVADKNFKPGRKTMQSVLLVEDNPDTQLLISRIVREEYDVTVAGNGRVAVDLAIQQHFDLVIMDINLGEGLNGVETLKEIRRLGKKDLPTVAVTAYALPGDRAKFIQNGFNDYLSKPFGKDELLTMIRKNIRPLSNRKAS